MWPTSGPEAALATGSEERERRRHERARGPGISIGQTSLLLPIFKDFQKKSADVNDDNEISVVDATLIQKYIVGLEKLTDLQKKSAEVNGDGEISVVDATLIQKYIVGLENFS